jgi:hypothetical protein
LELLHGPPASPSPVAARPSPYPSRSSHKPTTPVPTPTLLEASTASRHPARRQPRPWTGARRSPLLVHVSNPACADYGRPVPTPRRSSDPRAAGGFTVRTRHWRPIVLVQLHSLSATRDRDLPYSPRRALRRGSIFSMRPRRALHRTSPARPTGPVSL